MSVNDHQENVTIAGVDTSLTTANDDHDVENNSISKRKKCTTTILLIHIHDAGKMAQVILYTISFEYLYSCGIFKTIEIYNSSYSFQDLLLTISHGSEVN